MNTTAIPSSHRSSSVASEPSSRHRHGVAPTALERMLAGPTTGERLAGGHGTPRHEWAGGGLRHATREVIDLAVAARATRSDAGASNASRITDLFERQFAALAQDPEAFHATMADVYGADYDFAAAETVRRSALAGDFGWMPSVEIVDPGVLGGGNGAYDGANDRILIRSDLVGTELGATTLVEEVGHALDARLNTTDTAGDEGELFQRLLAGERPDATARAAMLADDDHGSVTVDGQRVDVEFSWFTRHVVDPIRERVIDPIVEHVVEPVGRAVVGLVQDVAPIVEDIARFPLDVTRTALAGGAEVISDLVHGDLRGAGQALVETGKDLLAAPVRQIVDTALMSAHATVNAIDNLRGATTERGLSAAEIAYLRPIYGESIDYGAVRIQSGGIKESLGFRANVVGNDVFMPEADFNPDGSLTRDGLETLGHEFGHVWQYQNRGADYLSGAIYAQVTEGSSGVGTGGAYDWVAAAGRGERFDDMNPESQAELASFIGRSLGPDNEVNRQNLQRVIRQESGDPRFVVDDALFATVQEAHDILRGLS